MQNIKRTILSVAVVLFIMPFTAFGQSGKSFIIRFPANSDMVYLQEGFNETELKSLESEVASLKSDILAGKLKIYVNGYADSKGTVTENLGMAKIRSNRVKSELIINQGVNENCFKTVNHSGEGNYVTLTIAASQEEAVKTEADKKAADTAALEAKAKAEAEAAAKAEADRIAAEEAAAKAAAEAKAAEEAAAKAAAEAKAAEEAAKAEAEKKAAEAAALAEAEAKAAEEAAQAEAKKAAKASSWDSPYSLALRTNLLRWATLTPDLGIEARVSPTVGITLHGTWTDWRLGKKGNCYKIWEVTPELRFYLGEKKRAYVGGIFKYGEYDVKVSWLGRDGKMICGGITGGYQLPLTDCLALDFTAAFGYLGIDYEGYYYNGNDFNTRLHSRDVKYPSWNVMNLGVTLVWKIL